MTDRELLQQALAMLEDINQCSLPPTGIPLPAEIDHVMEALRARLAQPKREWVGLTDDEIQQSYETTGHYQTLRPQDSFAVLAGVSLWATCMEEAMTKDNIQRMKNVLEQQGQRGTWDYDPYMHGMYNGMELMMALAEGRDPDYREAPEEWLGTQEKYRELLYAVASVFPNETRHQTALRYIKNAESHTDMKEKKEESNG